jgi:hypothetical protein
MKLVFNKGEQLNKNEKARVGINETEETKFHSRRK